MTDPNPVDPTPTFVEPVAADPDTAKDTSPEAPDVVHGDAPDGWVRNEDGSITAVDVPWKGYSS